MNIKKEKMIKKIVISNSLYIQGLSLIKKQSIKAPRESVLITS